MRFNRNESSQIEQEQYCDNVHLKFFLRSSTYKKYGISMDWQAFFLLTVVEMESWAF